MAGPTSGDHPAKFTNGAVEGQQGRSGASCATVARTGGHARPGRCHIGGQFPRPPERELFRRVGGGDRDAREALTAQFMPLARSVAMPHRRSSEPVDDLIQVAAVALIKAIDRYEPSRGVAFSSYAVPSIGGELKRYFRDRSWAVRPPRGLQELSARVDAFAHALTGQLGRAPTTAELSEAAGIDEEQVLEALTASSARAALSLQAHAGDDGYATLEDWIGHDDGGITSAETRSVLDTLLATLTARERLVVRLRFDEDLTQAQIGTIVGVSQIGVSRILHRALQRARHCSAPAPAVKTFAARR